MYTSTSRGPTGARVEVAPAEGALPPQPAATMLAGLEAKNRGPSEHGRESGHLQPEAEAHGSCMLGLTSVGWCSCRVPFSLRSYCGGSRCWCRCRVCLLLLLWRWVEEQRWYWCWSYCWSSRWRRCLSRRRRGCHRRGSRRSRGQRRRWRRCDCWHGRTGGRQHRHRRGCDSRCRGGSWCQGAKRFARSDRRGQQPGQASMFETAGYLHGEVVDQSIGTSRWRRA